MTLTFELPSDFNEVFAPGAFRSMLGESIPVNLGGATIPGKLEDAVVSPTGKSVKLTIALF